MIPSPTGVNGLEDYLRAAQAIDDGMVDVYFGGSPIEISDSASDPSLAEDRRQLEAKLKPSDFLSICQLVSKKYGTAYDLVASGNLKAFELPAPGTEPVHYRGYRLIREVARVTAAKAYVESSSGQTSKGVEALLGGLTFTYRVMPLNGLSFGYGRLGEDELLDRCADILPLLSLTDAVAVSRGAERLLSEPTPVISLLSRECQVHIDLLDKLDPHTDFSNILILPSYVPASTKAMFAQPTDAQASAIRSEMTRFVTATANRRAEDLRGPESGWYEAVARWKSDQRPRNITANEGLPELVDNLCRRLYPNNNSTVIMELRSRAKLRLLDLNARIVAYRWKFHKLPADLADLGTTAPTFDPLSNEPFVYRKTGLKTYQLYSKGRPETGEIDLTKAPSPTPRSTVTP